MSNIQEIVSLCEQYNYPYLCNEMMWKHTSFKIGGPAELFVQVTGVEMLQNLLLACKKMKVPYYLVGNGSNLLVSDSGIPGVVFHMGKEFSEIQSIDETKIMAQAGTSLSALCAFALDHSLTGLEFAWGIPATVGGAIRMNAGAYGGEIQHILHSSTHLTDEGRVESVDKNALCFSYRHSLYCDVPYIVTQGVFVLKKGDPKEIKKKMDDFMEQRKTKQPLEYPSAGSTFKRPQGAFAAQLIDQCGLKGYSIGNAKVSEKHAGFVVNMGQATSNEVQELIKQIQEIVHEKTGYCLEPEVEII